MKFFTSYELIFSLILSLFSGVIYGGVYCASESICGFVKKLFFLIPNSIRLVRSKEKTGIIKKIKGLEDVKLGAFEKNIFESLIFILFGIGMLILSYIALDGYIRLYLFISTGIFFLLSYRLFGKMFVLIFDKIWAIIYSVLLTALYIALKPIYKILSLILLSLRKVSLPVIKKIRRKRSYYLTISKISETEKVILPALRNQQ